MTPYRIRLTPPARRAIERDLPEKVAAAAVEFVYGALAENPHRVGKPLRGPLAPRYAARRGDYRVIYRLDDARLVVEITSILHRRDVYRT